jgi:hypothetical protein
MESQKRITICLQGGLGNQLFQIAAAFAVSQRLGAELCLVRNQFGGKGQGSHPSKYYDTIYRKIKCVDSLDGAVMVQQKGWDASNQSLLQEVSEAFQTHDIVELSGYFQSEAFFQDSSTEIRRLFAVPFVALSDILQKYPELRGPHNYGFIGVRRGDYLKAPHVHWPCGMTYYREAMKRLGCERYYITSDDMEWVRANFCGEEFRFFDIDDDLEQLYAAGLFSNYIISNSSFHWWGSFLSVYNAPRIIAPDKWINIPGHECIYRATMEVLERPVET